MSRNFKKHIEYILALIIISSCSMSSEINQGMNLSFEKTESFNAEINLFFKSSTDDLCRVNISAPTNVLVEQDEKEVYLSKLLSPLVITPDGKKLFVCKPHTIIEYNSKGSFVREVKVLDFNLHKSDDILKGIIAITNNRMWIEVYNRFGLKGLNRYIVEWPFFKEPEIRFVGPRFYNFCGIDKINGKAFLSPPVLIFDFHEKSYQTIDVFGDAYFHNYQYVDYVSEKGLLLSKRQWEKDAEICLVSLENNSKKQINGGICAFWGIDGHIYFLKGSTQLWRYNMESQQEEPVYIATKKIHSEHRTNIKTIIDVPSFSHDRRFIIFNPTPGKYTALLDLKQKQYKEYAGHAIPSHSMVLQVEYDVPQADNSHYFIDQSSVPLMPLYEAVGKVSGNEFEELLDRCYGLDDKDYYGNTALCYAILDQENNKAELLLQHGANPNIVDEYGVPLIVEATRNNMIDNVILLVKYGANFNAVDSKGDTSLHYAISFKHHDLIELLIHFGADIHLQNKNGRSAYDLALSSEDERIVKIIKGSGEK